MDRGGSIAGVVAVESRTREYTLQAAEPYLRVWALVDAIFLTRSATASSLWAPIISLQACSPPTVKLEGVLMSHPAMAHLQF